MVKTVLRLSAAFTEPGIQGSRAATTARSVSAKSLR